MKQIKSAYRHILSYLSVICLSLITMIILFNLNLKDMERKMLDNYDAQMQSFVSNFEAQLGNWGGVCYSIYNNGVFKSYVYQPEPIKEYELVSLLKGYENSIPMVTDIMIYNREAASVLTASGKVDASLYFSDVVFYGSPDVFLNDILHNQKAMLVPWHSENGDPLLTYMYPIQRVSPYQTRQDIYILLHIPKEQMDMNISNMTGKLNGRYEIFQNNELLYSTSLFTEPEDVNLNEKAHVLEYDTITGLYRFAVHIYPSSLVKQLKTMENAYICALASLLTIGVIVSIAYGLWSLKPMKRIEKELDSAHDMMRQQALTALLDGMPANEERLETADLTGKGGSYCALIIKLPGASPKLTYNVLSLLQGLPNDPMWRCKALEYERLPGIAAILEMESYSDIMLENIINMLQSHIRTLEIDPLIAIGGVKEDIAQLNISFGEAIFLSNSSLTPEKRVLSHQSSSAPNTDSVPGVELALFAQSLQLGTFETVVSSIHNLQEKLNHMYSTIIKYYTYSQLLSVVLNTARGIQMEIDPIRLNEVSNFLMSNKFWKTLQEISCDICVAVSEKNKTDALLEAEKVMQYISDNCLSYDISLEKVACHFDISMNRIGLLVKKMTGCTFREHLIIRRMEIAAKLLQETNDEVKTISSKIGYASVPHFIKTFKGVYYMTPVQYRRMKK